MEFPEDILQLIREFSKPLTRPNWRSGSPHAILFKQSNVSNLLKRHLHHCYNVFYITIYPELYDNTPITDIIQKYGENIFNHYNFYYFVRRYCLKATRCFCYNYYNNEWIYLKIN
jgi:hypothetical protein